MLVKKESKKICVNVQAILFDMDGVITDTMPYHFDVWKKIFDDLRINVNCFDIYKREGQAGIQTLREIFKEQNRKFRLKEARNILAQKEKMFKSVVRPRFIKGSLEFLSFAERKGFKLALVTGTSREEAKRILPRDILKKFDVVVTGSDVKKGKPHPEPYLKCLSRLNIPAPSAVVIENAPFGIQAAKKAKIFCIAIETSLPKKYLKGADIILKSFGDLRQRLIFG